MRAILELWNNSGGHSTTKMTNDQRPKAALRKQTNSSFWAKLFESAFCNYGNLQLKPPWQFHYFCLHFTNSDEKPANWLASVVSLIRYVCIVCCLSAFKGYLTLSNVQMDLGADNVNKACLGMRLALQCKGNSLHNREPITNLQHTASLSHLRTMLPDSSSCPQPAQRPNHAT